MKLYHFTSTFHLLSIIKSGRIRKVESNISLVLEHLGPDVVWLTVDDFPDQGWEAGCPVNKTEVRIELELSDAHHWPGWAKAHGISDVTFKSLHYTGGKRSDSWYVVERPIPVSEFGPILFTKTGRVIDLAELRAKIKAAR